jgi:hypothetical protein
MMLALMAKRQVANQFVFFNLSIHGHPIPLSFCLIYHQLFLIPWYYICTVVSEISYTGAWITLEDAQV